LLDQSPGVGQDIWLRLGQVEQTNQVRAQGAAVGRVRGDYLLADPALVLVKPAEYRHCLSKEITVHREGHQLIAIGRCYMIHFLAGIEYPDLACLQAPATPDGGLVRGQDGKAAEAAWEGPTLDVNRPVDSDPEDLKPSQLEGLHLTLERPAAELPEAKVPPGNCSCQFVEVRSAQRLQKHEPSPVVIFNGAELQFSDLIVPSAELRWDSLKKKNSPNYFLKPQ
jgi:hypothetical protein